MSNITIEWLSDECDCDSCGSSYADGANVFIEDVLVLELTPKAHCFNDVTYSTETVYEKILQHLGHTIEYEAS